MGKLDFGG
jgi:hypothetical protein